MDDVDTRALRAEIRAWFERVLPAEVCLDRAAGTPLTEEQDFAERRRYAGVLTRDGWAGLAWPREWGGRGGGYRERLVLAEEAARADAPDPLNRLGVDIIGPAIDVLCTDEQKSRFLPPILRGEAIWCQGFSEPGAGSDLSALSTRAERVPGGWRINGQKVWTSFGQYADCCVVLARTAPTVRPHAGISAFAVPMDTPGVEERPIRQMTGGSDFCEVFLTGVVVSDADLLGAEGDGWKFAMTALGFERSINFMARQVRLTKNVSDLVVQIRANATRVPSRAKERVVGIHARAMALQAVGEANKTPLDARRVPGAGAHAAEGCWSGTYQGMTDLGAELELTVPGFGDGRGAAWTSSYLAGRATTIYAGTSEIQRNIIAERGLGLPR